MDRHVGVQRCRGRQLDGPILQWPSWPLRVLQGAWFPWGLQQGWTQSIPQATSCSSAVCLTSWPLRISSTLKTRLSRSNPAGEGFIGLHALIKFGRLSGRVFCRATTTRDLMRSREVRWLPRVGCGSSQSGRVTVPALRTQTCRRFCCGCECGPWALTEHPAHLSLTRGLNPRKQSVLYSSEPILPFFCLNH